MDWNVMFFVNAILLGVGLAMDAFSVSLANGLRAPHMGAGKMCTIAGTFGAFQAAMPLLGWVCVHTIVQYFCTFEKCIPFIALALLLFIGGKMLIEGIHGGEAEEAEAVSFGGLLVQGIATSIDALSVGFTIAEYDFWHALTAALLISVVTFGICIGGLFLGMRFGMRFSGKATMLGGVILILIGLEIFLTGIL
jgi:putative Mn2+ efflux pump MntP